MISRPRLFSVFIMKSNHKRFFVWGLLYLSLLFFPFSSVFAQTGSEGIQEIKIGILAKRGTQKTHAKWDATADYLNQTLPGYQFRIVPMLFDEIPVLVKNKLVDFVIVNSGIYVDLSVKYGIRRVVTLVNRLGEQKDTSQFGSVIFTHKSQSNLQSLSDLIDKRIAAVHPTSLGGWVMALKQINKAGLEEWEFTSVDFLQTHDAVVEAVLRNEADVGIVRTDTLERMRLEKKTRTENLRIINAQYYNNFPFFISTPLYPEWPIAQLPHTSTELAQKVAVTLLQLPENHEAAIDARIAGWTIAENYQPVHEVLEYLQLSPYDQPLALKPLAILKKYWLWLLIALLSIFFLIVLVVRVAHLNKALKLRQNELIDSEDQLKATFDQAAVGIAHTTPSGQFLRLNNKLCEISGFSAHELENSNLKDLLITEDLPKGLQALDSIRRGNHEHLAVQVRIQKPRREELWVLLSISCIRNQEGLIKYFVIVLDDIHQLKLLEQQNHLEHHQKEVILDIAGDGILGLDPYGRHTFVNPAAAKMLGYRVEEMIGAASHSMWHHTRADGTKFPEHECPITSVLTKGITHRGTDETFWRKDGSSFNAEYISTPILREDSVDGAVVVFREIHAAK